MHGMVNKVLLVEFHCYFYISILKINAVIYILGTITLEAVLFMRSTEKSSAGYSDIITETNLL